MNIVAPTASVSLCKWSFHREMRALLPLLPLLALLGGCLHVRQEDLDTWKGIPVDVLEHHPLFASMPLEKRKLPKGGELWTFANCKWTATSVMQVQAGYFVSVSKACCNNQFLISPAGTVDEYRVIGDDCYTDESVRP